MILKRNPNCLSSRHRQSAVRYQQKMSPPSQLENDSGSGQNKADSSIGVTLPPPDITSMVDKAARFVASRNPWLEKFIAMNAGMRKYTFLNAADPYHAYYQHRLSELRAQNGSAGKTKLRGFPDKFAAVIEWILEKHESLEESAAVCDKVLISPITGELVTFNNLFRHMQDPKYKEQKERLFAKIRETTPAQDDAIFRCIIEVARACPDSFDTTEEEVCDAVKAELQSTYPRLFSDWPGPKRRRLDDSLLVPEDEFLSQHPGPALISVWVPDKGKMLVISVESLSDSVSSLKEKIAGRIEAAPPANKLKLSGNAGVFKDCLSLAYYNVAGGVKLSVSW